MAHSKSRLQNGEERELLCDRPGVVEVATRILLDLNPVISLGERACAHTGRINATIVKFSHLVPGRFFPMRFEQKAESKRRILVRHQLEIRSLLSRESDLSPIRGKFDARGLTLWDRDCPRLVASWTTDTHHDQRWP